MNIEELKNLVFYIVVNSDGQYFRRKGYGGYGDTWVDDVKQARVYANIGGARGTVTFFSNQYPQYPAPNIIKMTFSAAEIIDEKIRLDIAREKKKKQEQGRELRESESRLREAEADLERAKKKLEEAQRKKK